MGKIDTFHLGIAPLEQSPRDVWVYLPDDYETSKKTYPVLYMFDGHNLFDDELATYGKCWGIKDYLDNNHLPLVVIGVDCNHIGNGRLEEYCPFPVPENSWIGEMKHLGKETATWFVKKLKPACEKRYRIKTDRKNIGIAGSSMGGLMSIYCISKYNNIYSKAACVSPTMDISFEAILECIRKSKISSDTKIYLDFGSKEVKSKKTFAVCVDHLLTINHEFQNHGCNTFPNVVVGGAHCEASWETIVPVFLEYLFPKLYQ